MDEIDFSLLLRDLQGTEALLVDLFLSLAQFRKKRLRYASKLGQSHCLE